MKTLSKFLILFVVGLALVSPLGSLSIAVAQDIESPGYVPLALLPGTEKSDDSADIGSYVPGAVRLIIGLAALAAVFMIVLGGFQYMSTDAISKKDDGKNKIRNALWGLALVLASWLILNTINPRILEFNLNIRSAEAPPAVGGGVITGLGVGEQVARDQLEGKVLINKDPCTSSTQTDCTNVGGLPQNAIDGVIGLKNSCNCTVIITGGTEAGHATHAIGAPVLDIAKGSLITQYIIDNSSGPPEQTRAGLLYKIGNSEYLDEGDHWHICFDSACRISGR